MATIGERIRERRKELELDQPSLAKAVGVSNGTISFWETDTNSPKGKNLLKLSDVLGKSPSWILTGKEFDPAQLRQLLGEKGTTLLETFEKLSPANQTTALGLLEVLLAGEEQH